MGRPIFQGEHFTPRCEESGLWVHLYFRVGISHLGANKKWIVGTPIFQGYPEKVCCRQAFPTTNASCVPSPRIGQICLICLV